jgi:hypothetical protein
MKKRTKKLPTYEDFIKESYTHAKIGSIVEYVVPGTHKTHTGKVVAIEAEHLIAIDDKTDRKIRIPLSGIGPSYEE